MLNAIIKYFGYERSIPAVETVNGVVIYRIVVSLKMTGGAEKIVGHSDVTQWVSCVLQESLANLPSK